MRFLSGKHDRLARGVASGEFALKRLILAAVSTAALAGAIPAAALAQDETPAAREAGPSTGPGAEWPLERRMDWLARRIDHATDNGWLSGNEIGRGRSELVAIKQEEDRLRARDGGQLSPEDRTYLYHRIDELNRTLKWSGGNPPPPWVMG
jgi:hypothetical protein